jgi:SSS family solute:Na+ symporter
MDLYRSMRPQSEQRQLVWIGRVTAVVAIVIAILVTRPLLSGFDQAFQFIQRFTGWVTPGICVIFLLGIFWERTTSTAAMTAAVFTVLLSAYFWKFQPDMPFMTGVGICFLAGVAIAVAISLIWPRPPGELRVDIKNVNFSTGTGFNIAALIIVGILAGLYIMWW